jgi:hypothetical protein
MSQEIEYGLSKPVKPVHLPCGGVAYFDQDSGISYRCETCFAVVGSVGQPRSCKEEVKKYDAWKELGGQGWDYDKGEPYAVDRKRSR